MKRTVHFLQRQPTAPTDCVPLANANDIAPVATNYGLLFLARDNSNAPVATNYGVFLLAGATAMHPLPRTIDCFFLQEATDMPDAANYGLVFCRRHMALLRHAHLRTLFKENARQWLGAVSVAKRLTENHSNCPVLECMSLLACKNPVFWEVLLRAAMTFFALFNSSSCSSGDQYFKVANAMLTNSHAKVTTGSSSAFLATCLISS